MSSAPAKRSTSIRKSLVYSVTDSDGTTSMYQSGYSETHNDKGRKLYILDGTDWKECDQNTFNSTKSAQDSAIEGLCFHAVESHHHSLPTLTTPRSTPISLDAEVGRLRRENREMRQILLRLQ